MSIRTALRLTAFLAIAGGGHGARLVTIALALLAGFALLPRLVRRLRKRLVCRTHKRSEAAAEMLRSAGFSNLFVLRGGMEAWSRNLPKGNHEISFHAQ